MKHMAGMRRAYRIVRKPRRK